MNTGKRLKYRTIKNSLKYRQPQKNNSKNRNRHKGNKLRALANMKRDTFLMKIFEWLIWAISMIGHTDLTLKLKCLSHKRCANSLEKHRKSIKNLVTSKICSTMERR